MAAISFESRQQTACFHSPLKGGLWDEQQLEVRLDPLVGHQSVFNAALEDKSTILFPDTDEAYLRQRAEDTRAACFLCDDRWRQSTPRYGEDLLPDGRLIRGEIVLFPNLFPLAAYHAVIRLGDQHFRTLDDFPPSLLEDAFFVALEFIRRCHQADPGMVYFTINANYLFPAGASVLHPHLQILGSPFPGTHHRLLLEKSKQYFEKEQSCYWQDLVETEERLGARSVGTVGDSRWFTAFSPIGSNEVNAVWLGNSHFLEWGPAEIRSMAEGVSRVLRAYHAMKLSTFNFSCFSGPLGQPCTEFRCMLRLISRQNAVPHYRTDDYYYQKLLKNEIIVKRPEHLAPFIRRYFQSVNV